MHGCEPKFPIETVLKNGTIRYLMDSDDYAEQIKRHLSKSWNLARTNIN